MLSGELYSLYRHRYAETVQTVSKLRFLHSSRRGRHKEQDRRSVKSQRFEEDKKISRRPLKRFRAQPRRLRPFR